MGEVIGKGKGLGIAGKVIKSLVSEEFVVVCWAQQNFILLILGNR
jgi:hypothetical protein